MGACSNTCIGIDCNAYVLEEQLHQFMLPALGCSAEHCIVLLLRVPLALQVFADALETQPGLRGFTRQ